MNLILLFDSDFVSPDRVRLSGRRLKHAREILQVRQGQVLTVGKQDGQIGEGKVITLSDKALELDVRLHQDPPPGLKMTLIMPLARPLVLKRVLLCAASLGIKKIIILNFNRVEKSLWNSSALKPEAIHEQLVLGLEQAKDTVMPRVILRKRFKPFVQDEAPDLIKGTLALAAHPGASGELLRPVKGPLTLLIGPEGGLVDFEVEQLQAIGFQAIDLGPRILRVESVLPFLAGYLF